MVRVHLRLDLGLVRQGVSLGVQYGLRSLEVLGSFAELIEHSVYEPASLRRTADGFGFTLRNPPLRMGAFSALRLLLDGVPVPPDSAFLQPGGRPDAIPFSALSAAHPVEIPIGRRTRITVRHPPVDDGRHHVRLEFQNVAIPPLVWFEFEDMVREEETAA
ncbi:MAG TPA: hypothetical protein VFF67_02715 [Thermoplasmata archaeon]|nr:hypothetical protein [Thermoplasmata archaeon]